MVASAVSSYHFCYENMFRVKSNICKVWSKFTIKNGNTTIKFLIQDLPKNRIKEYLDFKVEHYMKYEAFHQATGILENPKALKEYLGILNGFLHEDSQGVTICCTDDENETSKIFGISAMKLTTPDDVSDLEKYYNMAKTKEVAKLYESFIKLRDIYPIAELMKKFKLELYYDDSLGVGVHAAYRNFGIGQKIAIARQIMCKEHNVTMCGSWAFSRASQIAAERIRWETVFKISGEDFSRRLGLTLKNLPEYATYIVKKIEL